MKKNLWIGSLFLLLILFVAGGRLLPHPPNFTPLMAIALFSGALLGRGPLAYLLPLGAMVVSDFFLGFHSLSGIVYLAMAPAVLLGTFAQKTQPLGEKKSVYGLKWIGLALGADLIFYVISNLGVWYVTDFYEKSVNGLIQCFTLALPFLLNQILGTGTFLGLLLFTAYGLKVLAGWRSPELSYQKYKN